MSEKASIPLSDVLETAQKLCASKGASVAELERVISSLPGAIDGGREQPDALTGRRRETLLSGTDGDLLKLDNDIAAANRLLDRLRAVAEELDTRLAQAREAESDAARARRRAELILERDRVADRLRKDYQRHATAIVALIEDSARSQVAVEEFNRAAPASEKIQDAETIVRQRSAAPREEIKRQIVNLWCREDENQPLPEEHQARVQDHGGGHGSIPPTPGCIGFRAAIRAAEIRARRVSRGGTVCLCAAARRRGIIAWSCRGRSKRLAIRARGFDGNSLAASDRGFAGRAFGAGRHSSDRSRASAH